MDPTDFGILTACVDHDVDPASLNYLVGVSEGLNQEKSAAVGRLLAKAAHAAMCVTGRQYTAPAYHLYFVSKQAAWDPHCQDVVDHVLDAIKVVAPLEKQAFSDALSAVGAGAKGVGYGSVGAGAGLGTLFWLLSRHANQDNSDIEGMRHQIDYYDQLSRELEDSMKRKYRYDSTDEPKRQNRSMQ